MIRKILFIVPILAIIGVSASAADRETWRNNTQLLPQYCKDRAKGMQSSAFKKWRGTFGKAAIHIHHYCSGVYSEQQAKSALNKSERAYLLGEVVSQMRYMSSACDSKCALYPELHTRWGWALSEQGQIADAIKHYQLAIKAKQTYTPAYAKLSDLYLKANQRDEARKILEAGLKARPKSRSLSRRLKELGSS